MEEVVEAEREGQGMDLIHASHVPIPMVAN